MKNDRWRRENGWIQMWGAWPKVEDAGLVVGKELGKVEEKWFHRCHN